MKIIIKTLLKWLNVFQERKDSLTIRGTIEKIEKQYTEKSYFGKIYHIEVTMKIHLWGDYISVPLEEGKTYEIEYGGGLFMDGYIRNITRI